MSSDVVPSFYLYGEPHRAVPADFIHVEDLGDRSRPSKWTIRPHAHADLVQIFLIERGGGAMQIEDLTLGFVAPALLLVPAGTIHGFGWTSESTGAVVTLARACLERLTDRHPDLLPVFSRPRTLQPGREHHDTVHREIAVLRRELGWSARGHHAAVEAALLALLVTTLRTLPPDVSEMTIDPGQHGALVARFRARIEHRFRLRETVAVHAAALNVSETSLRTACMRVAAQSPAAMLDQRAMLEARRALLYSDLSIAGIGYAVGFTDPAYFTRFFTRHAGRSPRQYRQERPPPDRPAPR